MIITPYKINNNSMYHLIPSPYSVFFNCPPKMLSGLSQLGSEKGLHNQMHLVMSLPSHKSRIIFFPLMPSSCWIAKAFQVNYRHHVPPSRFLWLLPCGGVYPVFPVNWKLDLQAPLDSGWLRRQKHFLGHEHTLQCPRCLSSALSDRTLLMGRTHWGQPISLGEVAFSSFKASK